MSVLGPSPRSQTIGYAFTHSERQINSGPVCGARVSSEPLSPNTLIVEPSTDSRSVIPVGSGSIQRSTDGQYPIVAGRSVPSLGPTNGEGFGHLPDRPLRLSKASPALPPTQLYHEPGDNSDSEQSSNPIVPRANPIQFHDSNLGANSVYKRKKRERNFQRSLARQQPRKRIRGPY